jgi:apolipoprotein N-acyltransferase
MKPASRTAHGSEAAPAARPDRARAPRTTLRTATRWLQAALPELMLFVGLTTVTVLLFSLIFPPRAWWPLAFVCLAPWAYAVCAIRRAWIVHWGSFFAGSIAFLINLYWLMPVTGLGFVALAFYLGTYWTLAAWAVRTGLRMNVSPVWTLPIAWVATEFLRAWALTGFPWLFLAHSFYEQPALIQISDTCGAYGVSFLAAVVSGLLVDLALRWRPGAAKRPGVLRLAVAGLATVALLIGNVWYGNMRLDQAQFEDGPKIAVIQEDFPVSNTSPPVRPDFLLARHFVLAAEALRQKPDIVAFPETAWNVVQNINFIDLGLEQADGSPAYSWAKRCHELTAALARGEYGAINKQFTSWEIYLREKAASDPSLAPYTSFPRLPMTGGPPATLIVGAVALDVLPETVQPRQKRFNSTLIYDPDGVQRRERYDKMHLVPFGEIVPFRNQKLLGFDLHWLYRFLNSLSPFSDNGRNEYSLWPGQQRRIFTFRKDERVWRFGTPICYEDAMPYVIRDFVWDNGRRRADFLVSVSNDGWFMHSAELAQHLAITVFRAVENRIGFARAVNTGISGFVDPNGKVYSLVEAGGRSLGPGITGFRIDHVKVDRRDSLYGRTGDWFAGGCTVLTSLLWLGAIITRWIFAARERLRAWRGKGAPA